MVVDVERVGDYTKNILDLALNYSGTMRAEEFSDELAEVEQEVLIDLIKLSRQLIRDETVAESLMSTYKDVNQRVRQNS